MRRLTIAVATLTLVAIVGCGDATFPQSQETFTDNDGNTFIVDQTGKHWEITYAVDELGFDPNRFNFGLGPNAILPILDPEFWTPDDPNYPRPTTLLRVLGATLDGDSKAYPVDKVAQHEVVNDFLASQPIAAAY